MLQSGFDVDGDGDFDANDGFLVHLVKLAGTNSQIDDVKGNSPLSAGEIRTSVEALGANGRTAGRGKTRFSRLTPTVRSADRILKMTRTSETAESSAATSLASASNGETDSGVGEFRDWLVLIGAV